MKLKELLTKFTFHSITVKNIHIVIQIK